MVYVILSVNVYFLAVLVNESLFIVIIVAAVVLLLFWRRCGLLVISIYWSQVGGGGLSVWCSTRSQRGRKVEIIVLCILLENYNKRIKGSSGWTLDIIPCVSFAFWAQRQFEFKLDYHQNSEKKVILKKKVKILRRM